MINIPFEFETDYGSYRDALMLPEDHGLSEADIEALKRTRLDDWLAVVTAPAPVEEQADG